jgi:histidinol-phosphate aminotransferase
MMVAIVNPNNPTGTVFDITENIGIIEDHPNTMFLIDEAFIEFAGKPAADLVHNHKNVVITRTFSKGFSLAGCRVGYAISNKELIEYLNSHNDAYPLSRTAEAAALASLNNIGKIRNPITLLKKMANEMSTSLQKIGFKTYPTETYFFLAKIPYPISADEFSKRLEKERIHIRPLHLEGLENKFVRFATSTEENNRIILNRLEKIF